MDSVRVARRVGRWVVVALALTFPLVAAPAPAPGPASTCAQTGAPADVEVSLSSGLVKVGEPVAIDVEVSSADGGRGPRVRFGPLPEVEGLRFGQPVQLATRTVVEMGRSGRSVSKTTTTYRIPIQATRDGEFSIPPLTMEVAGARVTEPLEPMRLKIAKDIEASQLLYFERAPMPETVYEGEPYELDLEFGWDAGMNPDGVQLQLPWWGRQDGSLELAAPPMGREVDFPVGPGRRTLKVEQIGALTRDGRDFLGFRLRRRFVATRPGTLEFSRSIFEFVRREGQPGPFSRGRTRTYYRPLEPFTLEVLPVPEEGRPFDWTGAVGRIEASRDAQRRDVDAGDVIPFELRYTGDGNLEFFDAPDLSRIPGFDRLRVLGVKDDKQPYERVITYDLVPLDPSVSEIPAVPLSVFDTEAAAFVTIESEPLAIRVRGGVADGEDPFAGAAAEPEPPAPIVLRDIEARPASARGGLWSRRPGAGLAASLLGLVLIGWVSLRRRVRAHGDPGGAAMRRRRSALRRFEAALRGSSGPVEQAAAFHGFLSARAGDTPEAWIGRDQLGHGIPESDERNVAFRELQNDLDRAAFGDGGRPVDPERLRALARHLVRSGF